LDSPNFTLRIINFAAYSLLPVDIWFYTNGHIFLHPFLELPYIPESNPHPFYSIRRLKNQMQIRIACRLDSQSKAGFWKNDRAAACAVRTIK